ncbi:hypothetical protein AX16_000182 [Volvariella volvacea WC 439]|nr:hypothetical protein AX16_000182 [Volvariella volvacea WC 439]
MASYAVLPPEFYNDVISHEAATRRPSTIRDFFHLELKPGMLGMLAGKPNESTFPVTGLSFKMKTGPNPGDETTIELTPSELTLGLQYDGAAGHPLFVEWVKNLVLRLHGRDAGIGGESPEGLGLCMGAGSQDLMYKAIHALVNPGDSVFVEAPTYPGSIPILASLNCNVIELDSDAEGLVPSHLRSVLENWPAGKPYPKILYTVPYGCNPSGATIPIERRREVLELSRKYKFIILEDDPYYHLHYLESEQPPSYLALEKLEGGEVGRVVRLDSFSKVLAGGLRLGWITAPQPILRVIMFHLGVTTLQTASPSQIIAYKILSTWGIDGFLESTRRTADFYKTKRETFDRALKKHLGELAEWSSPKAGLFFWVKLKLPPTPECPEGDADRFVRSKAIPNLVILLPGQAFFYSEKKSPYVRFSFSTLDEERVDIALGRLADLLRQDWDEYKAKCLPN